MSWRTVREQPPTLSMSGASRAADARVRRAQDYGSRFLERRLEDGGRGGADGADQGLHAAHQLGVPRVGGVVVREAGPVQQGELRAGAEDAVELLEESNESVLAEGQRLGLVEAVEGVVLERSGSSR